MTGVPARFCPTCGSATETVEHERRERRFCPSCGEFVWQNSVPVATVVVHEGPRALFVERAIPPDRGEWDLPGGFLEAEEHPRVGVARELEEEAGLGVDPAALTLCHVGHESRGERYLLPVVYAVERAATEGEPTAGSDAAAVAFDTPAALSPVRAVARRRYDRARAHRED